MLPPRHIPQITVLCAVLYTRYFPSYTCPPPATTEDVTGRTLAFAAFCPRSCPVGPSIDFTAVTEGIGEPSGGHVNTYASRQVVLPHCRGWVRVGSHQAESRSPRCVRSKFVDYPKVGFPELERFCTTLDSV